MKPRQGTSAHFLTGPRKGAEVIDTLDMPELAGKDRIGTAPVLTRLSP